jgi:hypothetical protein
VIACLFIWSWRGLKKAEQAEAALGKRPRRRPAKVERA